jgi:hypothetical protein
MFVSDVSEAEGGGTSGCVYTTICETNGSGHTFTSYDDT